MTVTKLDEAGGAIEGTFDMVVSHGANAALPVTGSFHVCRVARSARALTRVPLTRQLGSPSGTHVGLNLLPRCYPAGRVLVSCGVSSRPFSEPPPMSQKHAE